MGVISITKYMVPFPANFLGALLAVVSELLFSACQTVAHFTASPLNVYTFL